VSEERQESENFSKKAVVLVMSGKNQVSPLLPPLGKHLKSTSGLS